MNRKLDISALQVLAISVLVLMLGAVVGNQLAQSQEARGARGNSPVTIKRLTGHADFDTWKLTVAAILIEKENREFDGVANVQGSLNVRGVVVSPPDARGRVVEVVPPENGTAHWCVNVELDSIEGFNALVYIIDSGDGKDSLDSVLAAGDFGATCATYPAPQQNEFSSVTRGDFRSSI